MQVPIAIHRIDFEVSYSYYDNSHKIDNTAKYTKDERWKWMWMLSVTMVMVCWCCLTFVGLAKPLPPQTAKQQQ